MTRYATFHGLNCWYKYLFEKFGWMILAKNHGNKIQIHLNNKKTRSTNTFR
jgi:hypothetical protein